MELRHLRYFMAVAETRNFTRAARVLGVSQPPLSRQIRDLEVEMGVQLLQRNTRPVLLTDAGRLFADQARQILAQVDLLAQSMHHMSSPRFAIGVVGSIMQGAMPRMIRAFRDACPHIDVELVELTTVEQVAALKEGRIDAGLGRLRIEDADIQRTLLYAEPLVLATPAEPGAEAGKATLADLSGKVLIVYPSVPRPSYADQVLGLLADKGIRPGRLIEVREVQTALGLVAARAGVAIVPESLRNSLRSDIAYTPFLEAEANSPVILSQRRSDQRQLIETFRTIGQAAFGEEP
ncbi:LysR family transcriptional regulator [Novosphingobium rosa]|uniref:LysR family transcriptional regulator n=1 Tax=Novosphingobium rosa TaxID=76978 RepID=UPI00082B0CE2|nr:LysR family transcriptional regulator [Novosphingobium rosa]